MALVDVTATHEDNVLNPDEIKDLVETEMRYRDKQLIRMKDEVRFSFTQPKQILEMFLLLCSGRKEYYEDLCRLFNNETQEGKNMTAYSDLMKKAVSNIAALLGKRNELQLDGRGGKLIDENKLPKSENDFELIFYFKNW